MILKILVTGFESYGGYEINPTERLVRDLQGVLGSLHPEVRIVTSVLPVSFRSAGEVLLKLLREERPQIYVGTGLRPGSTFIAVERVALNIKDARYPDNAGEQPVDEPIDPEGPAAYFSTLPVKSIVRKLREEGIPAAVSYSAGTYLCNYVMYLALHHSARYEIPVRAGFVHVPFSQPSYL